MPTYEYQCSKCGTVFDLFQSIKAAPLRKTRCEKCDAVVPVKRLIGSGGAILFKGTGFYETDYRRAKKGGEAEKEKSNTPAAETKSTDSESNKPAAATTETKPAKDTSPAKPEKSKKKKD